MNRVKGAVNRFRTRSRGRGDGGRGGGGERRKSRGKSIASRAIPAVCALMAAIVVFAVLEQCEYGTYALPLFKPAWCSRWTQTFGLVSISGGVGFVIFLTSEVSLMILAQMWKDRQIDRAERREEAAERRADAAERQADAAERRAEVAERQAQNAERNAEMAEQARRADAERAERDAEASKRQAEVVMRQAEAVMRQAELVEQARRDDAERAERRELRLIELIESLKNGNGKSGGSE